MRQLRLVRHRTGDDGTFGRLSGEGMPLGSGSDLVIGELPWRLNVPWRSCIPSGSYRVDPHSSMRFGECLRVGRVRGRSSILLHAGNWCGAWWEGLRSDSRGCLLPGLQVGDLAGQSAVLSSRVAMGRLLKWCGGESFRLEVVWAAGVLDDGGSEDGS